MAKNKSKFVCNSCGAITPRWSGKCDSCGEWNCIEEKVDTTVALNSSGARRKDGKAINFQSLQGSEKSPERIKSGINEFDRVCGGGLVSGMASLIGGDPGIGKSTLLLQVAANLSKAVDVAYVSGEESLEQIRLRASRLGVEKTSVKLASSTNINDIITTMEQANPPQVMIVDSIQTMFIDSIESAPGTVSQVRACAGELVRVAKSTGVCVFIVGHVTKDGAIAGPRVLEHMVDTVLYFEGERTHPYRILRSVKNRFGATNEIGVFDMTGEGLQEVADPSAIFLSNNDSNIPGTSVFAGIEGSRPVLVEIQSLLAASEYSSPKRATVGWDSNRLSMILAVLESRGGLNVHGNDVYLNVAGGLKITEPACDLACASAIISSLINVPLPKEAVFFGEIGLSGEIRQTPQIETRLKEAIKLGFTKAYIPKPHKNIALKGINIIIIKNLAELYSAIKDER
ncbi:MAG: DNA repair protein RadA [Alphaproteobacteria bacterium]